MAVTDASQFLSLFYSSTDLVWFR